MTPENKVRPLVTIGCLSYNTESFVIETLESIINQPYENIEVFIVDDASKDGSVDKIQNFIDRLHGSHTITFIRNAQNKGICANMNTILAAASGTYITYIAADDIILPNKIEDLVLALTNAGKEYGMAYSNVQIINEESKVICDDYFSYYQIENKYEGYIYTELLCNNFIPAMSTMINADVLKQIGGFDENLYFEDLDAWLRIAKHAKIAYLNKATAQYRIRNTSMMRSNYEQIVIATAHVFKKQLIINSYHKKEDQQLISQKIRDLIINYFKRTGKINLEVLDILKRSGNNYLLLIFSLSHKAPFLKSLVYRMLVSVR